MKNNSKMINIYAKDADGYIGCIGTATVEGDGPFEFGGNLHFGDIIINQNVFAYAITLKQDE